MSRSFLIPNEANVTGWTDKDQVLPDKSIKNNPSSTQKPVHASIFDDSGRVETLTGC